MSIYREYDIRGVVTEDETINVSLNKKTVTKIGYNLGIKIKKSEKYIAVGYDARIHSQEIFRYLANGLNQAGITVINLGLIPTPLAYFVVNIKTPYNVLSSIMITGSHNPPEYNGLKITMNRNPFYANDIYSMEKEVENSTVEYKNIKSDIINLDIKKLYINFMVKEFNYLKGFNDKKIVYDCGNGVAGTVITDIFKQLNIATHGIYTEPDGTFPNHHPDPSIEANLSDIKEELKKGYDLGFAFDGDADRIAVLTKENNIKGDVLAILYSLNIKNPIVVGEVKCSKVMYDTITDRGGKTIMYKTGHSNLKVKIKEVSASLAVEVSGHIFFNDRYFGYDDAIYATFRLIELIYKKIDIDNEIAKLPKVYSTDEIKIKTTENIKFKLIERIVDLVKKSRNREIKDLVTIDGVRIVFNNGWALVRASNTTPVLVTRFESTNIDKLNEYQEFLMEIITKAKEDIK